MTCEVSEKFGPHKGEQLVARRYFKCGCDYVKCEGHIDPFGFRFVKGKPKKCKEHRKAVGQLNG